MCDLKSLSSFEKGRSAVFARKAEDCSRKKEPEVGGDEAENMIEGEEHQHTYLALAALYDSAVASDRFETVKDLRRDLSSRKNTYLFLQRGSACSYGEFVFEGDRLGKRLAFIGKLVVAETVASEFLFLLGKDDPTDLKGRKAGYYLSLGLTQVYEIGLVAASQNCPKKEQPFFRVCPV